MDQTQGVLVAINRYFDLMYDANDQLFSRVFHSASSIHGIRDGSFVPWSAADFRELLRNRQSPAAMRAPRDQGVQNIDLIASDLAAATVQVRIGQISFIDHLVFHCVGGEWLITAKAFHIARTFPAGS